MSKVIFAQGIPGSGKSWWAKAYVKEDPEHRIRINYDDLRNMFGQYWVTSRESVVINAGKQIIIDALNKGYDVVVDNMNLSENSRKPFIDAINDYNLKNPDKQYEIKFKLFNTPKEECIRRDSTRKTPIGKNVINILYGKYKDFLESQPKLEVPELETKEEAVIFDIDSTLCFNTSGRPWYGDGASEGMDKDEPYIPMLNILKSFISNPNVTVFVVTGRNSTDDVVAATNKWFVNNGIDPDSITIIYRGAKDFTHSDTYKRQIVDSIAKTFKVIAIFDDDERVIKTLREAGYPALPVSP